MEISPSLQEIIIGYYEGSLTQEQADELLTWTGKSKENLLYFRQIGELYYASVPVSDIDNADSHKWQKIEESIDLRDIRRRPRPEIRLYVSTLYKAAATLLLLIGLGIAGFIVFKKDRGVMFPDQYVETSAPKGSRSFITLPDSTVVWLNAGTTFRYPVSYGLTTRAVELRGEAYFKVAKNARLPFIVNTNCISVTALGTAFNVKAYDEENTIETTLEEGSVSIALARKPRARDYKPVILKPRQNAVFLKQTGDILLQTNENTEKIALKPRNEISRTIPLSVTDVPDTRIYTSWKESRWIFKNEKLGSLVPKLERRYDVNIVFMNEDLKEYAFSGTLLEESLEQVLTALQLSAPVRFEIKGKDVRLYSNKGVLDYYNLHKTE